MTYTIDHHSVYEAPVLSAVGAYHEVTLGYIGGRNDWFIGYRDS